MMIPKNLIDQELEVSEEIEPSKTYKITNNQIQGYVDGLEALRQAIYKILNTERYEYPIYSFSYGVELEDLIGKDPIYVQIELKRRISECLLQDDRAISITNFQTNVNGDEIECSFDVQSIYGDLNISQEVSI